MVKLNKKKGRRSGKRIQYNLARRSLKKKSKKNNKSKKVFMGGFLLPKSNEYDDKATISFDITNNCSGDIETKTLRFKSQDNMRDLTKEDEKNFVLLKHKVLDEKLLTSPFKTPLYAAYFKIPKIIFSLCKQKSKGDKNNLKLTVQYQETGKKNSFDISHNCIPSKFDSMNNMVKTQVETDATGVKDAFKNALENHTSYNDQISAFLDTYKNNLSEETIKKIKNKYGSNEEYVKESIKKAAIKAVEDVLKNKETHVVKEECDETKQLLKGMTITINPDGSVQFNKSGENTEQDMHKVINNMSEDLNLMKTSEGKVDINTKHDKHNESDNVKEVKVKEVKAVKEAVSSDSKNVEEKAKAKAQKAMETEINSSSSNEDNKKAAVDNEKSIEENVKAKAQKAVETEINSSSSNEDNKKAAVDNEKSIEENVKAEAQKAVRTEIDSTSSNEKNVEKNVNDAAEKKVTEELVKVEAIKAVEQAVGQTVQN